MAILLTLEIAALRRAGITKRPGIIPSTDQTTELTGEANRLLNSWNCDGHKVFNTLISLYDLISGQKQYSIGPGGDFDGQRPLYIEDANFLFPTSPAVRLPIQILEDEGWSKVMVQDIPAAPPWYLYYDRSYNSSGQGQIFIVGQPPSGYQLELYMTQNLSTFASSGDTVVWPPGYEYALETNLALCACALFPLESTVATNPRAMVLLEKQASQALNALIILNSTCPVLRNETAQIGGYGGTTGIPLIFAGGGGGVRWILPNVLPDGFITSFTFASTPRQCSYTGLMQYEGAGYIRTGNTVQFIDDTGAIITPVTGADIRAQVN